MKLQQIHEVRYISGQLVAKLVRAGIEETKQMARTDQPIKHSIAEPYEPAHEVVASMLGEPTHISGDPRSYAHWTVPGKFLVTLQKLGRKNGFKDGGYHLTINTSPGPDDVDDETWGELVGADDE